MKLDNTSLARAIRAKYMGQEFVHSNEEAIEAIKEAPVVIGYIDEKYLDKRAILAYIEANKKYSERYYQSLEPNGNTIKSGACVRCENRDFLINGVHPAYCGATIDLSKYYDEDVLIALSNSDIEIEFTQDSYNEKIVVGLINKGYHIIYAVYEYWVKNLDRDKKTDAHIRTKYNLRVSDSYETVALYKCIELIENKGVGNSTTYAELILTYGNEIVDNSEEYNYYVEKFMRRLDVSMQNDLARSYLLLTKYMNPEDIDEDIIDYMVENCPIAGNILPDDVVLSHGLRVKDLDEKDTCRSCFMCQLRNGIII